MTKINHTLDRSQEWSFDMFPPANATDGEKMAFAWATLKDILGDQLPKLAADMDVVKIEPQNVAANPEWHIAYVKCSKRALRAFQRFE